MSRTALALAATLPLLAASARAADWDPLAGRIAGPAEQCVSLDRIQGPDVQTDGTIIYRQNSRRLWMTRPVGPCPGLRPPVTLIVDVFGSRLCRNDRFRTQRTNSIIPGPVCRFGAFVPYDKPARVRARSD